MKKLMSFALAVMLMLTMCFFVACESNNNPDPDTPSGQTPSGGTNTDPGTDPKPEPQPEVEDDGWVSAVFGGGPFVWGQDSSLEVVSSTMKSSGFNTMIIWSVHVNKDDTLYLNDKIVCDKGELVVAEETLEMWADLKKGDSSIKRVEISVGAWGCQDFESIKYYIDRDGNGENTMLYKNFKALIEATGADAVNFDDESCYDVESATKFGEMCANMGVKVALCPYDATKMNFWVGVKENLGDVVDRVYVQCYDGGAGNTKLIFLSNWAQRMGMKVIPGYYCSSSDKGRLDASGHYTASTVMYKLDEAFEYITGGFMWLYDEMQKLSSPNSVNDYAAAINSMNPKNFEN